MIQPWIQTYTGRAFWPLEPRERDIHIEDIAHALSNQCRFSGHCDTFYSVAEHSVHVATLVGRISTEPAQFEALLHDASEAYIVDIPKPIKPLFAEYGPMEKQVQGCIERKFSLITEFSSIVKKADVMALAWEARDLMTNRDTSVWGWSQMGYPEYPAGLPAETLNPLPPCDAKKLFLENYHNLKRI